MARTSPVYYIAPSAISIVPNCNGTANDLAVYVSRGTKIKVFAPGVERLGINPNTNSFREWTLTGRNRRLNCGNGPYTIYARLQKSEVYVTDGSAYLVFAAQSQYGPDNPYGLAGQWFDKYSYVMQDGLAGQYDERGFPKVVDHPDYWWIKMGTVSAPDENNQRTVDLDTGILGTEEYNNRWRLNPDDLPDNPVRTVITDRGSWAQTPHVIYRGPTGTRTPDGTLPAAVAAALGWEGTEPLTFTNGEPIAEPYHRESLTRHRFIAKRLDSDNSSLTDADLYEKLTTVSKGWEEENELETSRAWNKGALWECVADGTTQEPWFGSDEWRYVSGGTISLGFYSDDDPPLPVSGISVRPGYIDETVVPYLLFSQEDISSMVTEWQWTRESRNSALDETWKNTARTVPDDPTSPLKSVTRTINVKDADLPEGWETGSGKVSFKCVARFTDIDGEEAEIINTIRIV